MTDKVLQTILDAKCPEEIFGSLYGDEEQKLQYLKLTFHQLVKAVHPDINPDKVTAGLAFARLTEARTAAEGKIRAGSYGDNKSVEPKKVEASPVIVEVHKKKYIIKEKLFSGDIADLYDCISADSKDSTHVMFKITRAAGDNDLMDNEAKYLKSIVKDTDAEMSKLLGLLPNLLDTFSMRDSSRNMRRVNVLSKYDEYLSLEQIVNACPDGIDFRDMTWMFKRLLSALHVAHSVGVIHGAVIPSHVLVHPVNHGAILLDWTASVKDGETVKLMSKTYKFFYAPEIPKKRPVSTSTDIFMATQCMIALLGGDPLTQKMPDTVPKKLQAFLRGCALSAPHARPDDAWQLHKEFDELIFELVGKRTYRPFAIPTPS